MIESALDCSSPDIITYRNASVVNAKSANARTSSDGTVNVPRLIDARESASARSENARDETRRRGTLGTVIMVVLMCICVCLRGGSALKWMTCLSAIGAASVFSLLLV